jgi:hypothetical protein
VAYVSGSGKYGTTLTLTVSGVTAGQVYYIKVAGADTSPFGDGAYAMALYFGTNPAPVVSLPNTQTPNGSPLKAGGGVADTYDPAAESQFFLADQLAATALSLEQQAAQLNALADTWWSTASSLTGDAYRQAVDQAHILNAEAAQLDGEAHGYWGQAWGVEREAIAAAIQYGRQIEGSGGG